MIITRKIQGATALERDSVKDNKQRLKKYIENANINNYYFRINMIFYRIF